MKRILFVITALIIGSNFAYAQEEIVKPEKPQKPQVEAFNFKNGGVIISEGFQFELQKKGTIVVILAKPVGLNTEAQFGIATVTVTDGEKITKFENLQRKGIMYAFDLKNEPTPAVSFKMNVLINSKPVELVWKQ